MSQETEKHDESEEPAGSGAASETTAAFKEKPDDDTIEKIESERQERLDPDNRPEGVEVDNTHRTFDSEAGMFTDSEGYDEMSEEDKPYDDEAGEMAAPHHHQDTDDSGDSEDHED